MARPPNPPPRPPPPPLPPFPPGAPPPPIHTNVPHPNPSAPSTTALGGTTQSPYVVVPDADEVYQRAKGNGAEIVIDIKDEDYGGRGFSCRDPEGHLWNIGTYDPWRIKA